MRTNRTFHLLLAAALFSLCTPGLADDQPVSWVSTSGKSVEATFTGMTNGVVYLRGASGRIMKIGLSSLSEESKLLAQEMHAKAPPVTQTVAPAASGGRSLATYSAPFFDCAFDSAHAEARISIKENGSVVMPPLLMRLHVYYHDKGKNEWVQRKAVGSEKAPTYKQGEARYWLELEDGVTAEVLFRAHQGGIDMGYTVKDPPGIAYPSQHMLRTQLEPAYAFDGETETYTSPRCDGSVSKDILRTKFASCSVALKPMKGMSETYAYTDPVERFVSPLKSWVIRGAYGPRTLEMQAPKKDCELNAYIYNGYTPGNGYQLNFVNRKASSPHTINNTATLLVK